MAAMSIQNLFGRDRVADLEIEVAKLSRRFDLLLESLGVELDEAVPADIDSEIQVLLARGKKIDAIKLYRRETRASLQEAKAAIDAMQRDSQPRS